jgi:hypothetical protein
MSEGTLVTGGAEGAKAGTETNTEAGKVEGAGGVDQTKVDGKATAEGKEAEGAKDDKSKDPNAKPAGAPEKYEDFTLPDGLTIPDDVKASALTLFKDLNLSQEAAQKLIDFQMGVEQKAAADLKKHWDTTHETWVKGFREDKEIGGENEKQSLAYAKAALASEFATPALKEALEVTGAGNHPEVIRLLARLGKAVSDDKSVLAGKAKGDQSKDPAKKLFPSFN